MKNVRVIIGLIGFSFGMVTVAAQEQILDVSICIQSDKSVRRGDVDACDLEKYGQFGMKKPGPFDTYFSVKSVLYKEYLDSHGCVYVQQDLIRNIPQIIQKGLAKGNTIGLVEKYKFPKYVSGSFVERVKQSQNTDQPVTHTIYKNKKNALTLRYKIEVVEAERQRMVSTNSVQVSSVQRDSCQKESSFDDDSMLHLGATFLWLLSIANL